MSAPVPAATAVLNVSREGRLLGPTLLSLSAARARAAAAGHRVELLVVADSADAPTRAVLSAHAGAIDRVLAVDHGDLGAARAAGIAAAAHDWVFLHDGDDLFSSNWYSAFFEAAAAGEVDPGTVLHTEIFARFGDLLDLRALIDSDDPRFHPLFLTCQWYFSNKAVLHRDLARRFPLPHNRVADGVGNEDWAWSCDTIHAGVRHRVLPGTACFYRVKPAGQSLGLTPGMIHRASPLFLPANIAALARARSRALPPAIAPPELAAAPRAGRAGEMRVPDWFWDEVDLQGGFEAQVTDLHGLRAAGARLPLPDLLHHVAAAAEHVFARLDGRPKVFVFAGMATMRAPDAVVALLLAAARDHEAGAFQPVLVVEEGEFLFGAERLAAAFGAAVVSMRLLQGHFGLARREIGRFLMRPLIQFPGSLVLDLGSETFAALTEDFARAIRAHCADLRLFHADLAADPLSPAWANLLRSARNWRRATGTAVPVAVAPASAPLVADPAVWQATCLGPRAEAALARATLRRLDAAAPDLPLVLADLFAPPAPPAPPADTPAEAAAAGPYPFHRAPGTWLPADWPGRAAALLDADPALALVVPAAAADLMPDGRYGLRRIDPDAAAEAFGTAFERAALGTLTALAALARHPLAPAEAMPAGALAAALFRTVRAGGRVAVLPDTIAILRDPVLAPAAAGVP